MTRVVLGVLLAGASLASQACVQASVAELPPPVPVTFIDGGSDPHASCTANISSTGGCSIEGDTCELTDNASRACNLVATCVSGAWIDNPAAMCLPSATCLASGSAQVGTDCTRGPGSLCAYANTLCGCTPTDAGVSRYACVSVAAPCPFRRPSLGTACVEDITCDYGACTFELGSRVRCASGTWRDVPITCP